MPTTAESLQDTLRSYRPGYTPLVALERLVRELEVSRDECSSAERAGFTLLLKKGLVRARPRGRGGLVGTFYRTPRFQSYAEEQAWWAWAERLTGTLGAP